MNGRETQYNLLTVKEAKMSIENNYEIRCLRWVAPAQQDGVPVTKGKLGVKIMNTCLDSIQVRAAFRCGDDELPPGGFRT